ncbi:MAG: maltose ABC transporter substrate-binding protein [Spirochaetaceae bacterium]|jgi:arabinogalactan oligomer/maltooligosaccharide transport system substrate-binding protein|nr:maltose ABC transporter substrate-binding protein [Spirochaetaceae bacterium]
MRRLLTLIVVCALGTALVLVSCTKKETAAANQPSNAGAASGSTGGDGISGSLLVWLDNEDWANAVIKGFNQRYPNVTVKFETVGSVDMRGKVSLDGPAGIGPDVFILPHDHMGNAVIDGILEPFAPEQQKKYTEMLLDASIKTCTSEGELYAVPISTENIAFFYNKDLLGEKPVPSSFEEVIAFAQEWNVPSENKWALRWQVDDSYMNYFFLTAFGMQLFGPDMDDFKVPGWDTEAARKGVEFHKSLRRYFNVNVADATWDATTAAFQQGEVPFTISGPWAISDAKKNGTNFGITKLPTINGVQPRCFSGNVVACVSSYTNNPDAAFAFVDYLVSIEGETIQFETTGKLAAYKDTSVIPGLRDDPLLMGIMEQAPYADPMPIIPEMAQAWDAQKALFTFTWDDQLSIPDAQKKAIETYDTALMMAGKSRQ